ncbi:MAG: DNA primase [Lentisphaerae bacterium ADurb.BinA184]|nr:MAG: DNA primase [Lentisphaerae bacterium ADurb.BinA184]
MPGVIAKETIEEIRRHSDLVAVVESYFPLQKRGDDFWACCPFHREKTPSFKVSPSHQSFYCFGCKKTGDVFHFVMDRESTDFPTAVRLLARRAGIPVPETEPDLPGAAGQPRDPQLSKDRVLEVLGAASTWYREQLHAPSGEPARRYLAERGLDDNTVALFGLGYSPDSWDALLSWAARRRFPPDLLAAAGLVVAGEGGAGNRPYDRFRGRLMFPIWDELGRVVGFSARILDKEAKAAKYVNTPETVAFHKGRLLYGLHLARPSFRTRGAALICEGQLDTIACHRAGLTHAVAPQGTAFTEVQARLLTHYTEEVIFAFDADEAGRKAAVRSLQTAFDAGLRARVVTLPEGEDPDSIFRRAGAEALQGVMAAGADAFDYLFGQLVGEHDVRTPQGRDAVVHGVLALVMRIPKPVVRSTYCQWLAHRLGLNEAAVFEALRSLQRAEARRGGNAPDAAAAQPPVARTSPADTSAAENALRHLFDLALWFGPLAHQLAANENLTPERMGDSPVEKALLLVLARTVEDAWQGAGTQIAALDVGRDPVVAEILGRSEFPALPKDKESPQYTRALAKLTQAATDCLCTLERERRDRRLREIQTLLEAPTAPDDIATLMAEYQDLVRRNQKP